MKFEITDEELKVIKNVNGEKNAFINQLLTNNVDNDIALYQENDVEFSKDFLISNIDIMTQIYTSIVKNYYNNLDSLNQTFYKETNIAEIDNLKNNPFINKFIILKNQKPENKNNLVRPVLIKVILNEKMPYINLNDDKIMLTPFTFVKNISNDTTSDSDISTYTLELEMQDEGLLNEEEQNELYEKIINTVDLINQKMQYCIELDEDNSVQYENIRKLEQLLAKHNYAMEQSNYDTDTSEEEKQSDMDDIARINLELDTLKNNVTNTFYKRQENYVFIANWKNDLILYLKNKFTNISLDYKIKNDEITENIENESEINSEDVTLQMDENSEVANDKQVTEENEEKTKFTGNPEIDSVKSETMENVAVVNTLLTNIKNLISKQQNHARIAETIDAHYKALNNAFEMKNYAEELDSLVKAISNKVDTLTIENDKEELDKISKTSIQISILLNYLNNAKSPVSKKITRFDEINIIEENELKKEIAETIKNIRCEAELKKLNDDEDIIEDKSPLKRFIGRFTGKNKLDEVMLNQIKIRQTAIRKTFKAKMPLSYNYSIHELIAEIEMFIKENYDDELVLEDVNELRKIKDTLKKNFVIIDSKVISIIDQKTGKNLPLSSHKLTKKEIIEIDTYRFLNKYGYDKTNDVIEPEYQDTLANEISRIIDYIKTSNVLEN